MMRKQELFQKSKNGNQSRNYNYRRWLLFSLVKRYWGRTSSSLLYYKDGIPYTLPVSAIAFGVPEVEKYLPTEDGDPPLGNAKKFRLGRSESKSSSCWFNWWKNRFSMELSENARLGRVLSISWIYGSKNDGEFCAKDFIRLVGTSWFIHWWKQNTHNWSLVVLSFLEYVFGRVTLTKMSLSKINQSRNDFGNECF